MKKNILYALVACLAFSFAACSDDPLDATEKHVYGQNENPYIKTNTAATITAAKQELPVQRIDETLEIKLADYAEKFQTIFGMTVDQAISGLSNGNIVFYPMNIARNKVSIEKPPFTFSTSDCSFCKWWFFCYEK